jgi:hypothetical protein
VRPNASVDEFRLLRIDGGGDGRKGAQRKRICAGEQRFDINPVDVGKGWTRQQGSGVQHIEQDKPKLLEQHADPSRVSPFFKQDGDT